MSDIIPFRRKRRKWTSARDYGQQTAPRFDAKWNRKRRRATRWRRWNWLLPAFLAAVLAAIIFTWPGRDAEPTHWNQINITFRPCGDGGHGPCVIDGDTVSINNRRIRLNGYDTPEMDGKCAKETMLAQAAKAALVTWLAEGTFEWDGGVEPPLDRYGRELRTARRGEELLADRMITAGLAAKSYRSDDAIDWCGDRSSALW